MFGGAMGGMPSVMSHSFSRVPQAEIPRSSFDRSHGYKTTLDAGYLVPVFVDEAHVEQDRVKMRPTRPFYRVTATTLSTLVWMQPAPATPGAILSAHQEADAASILFAEPLREQLPVAMIE